MTTKIETNSALKLIAACAVAAALTLGLAIDTSPSQRMAYCDPAEARKVPIGCLNPDPGTPWYPNGGGTAGRPMIAYGIRI
jgi:ABC-type sugar transport system substrate-binding protein